MSKTHRNGGAEVSILREVDLLVEPGEVIAILGVSGTGKSTLLNVLGGIDRPSGGRLRVADRDLGALSDAELTLFRRDVVGFVFQFYNLIPSFTAAENVVSALEAAGRHDARGDAHARELLEAVGLGDKLQRFPEELSGGEQQRVAIARALVKRPPLVLADEPTGNLDPDTGASVLRVLLDEVRSQGATLLLVTHNPAIGDLADRVLRLARGRLEGA